MIEAGASGVPEVWIANIAEEALEVYRVPEGGAYRETRVRRRGDAVAPGAFPDLVVAVDEVFG
jgi:Uma2 family endonuclease